MTELKINIKGFRERLERDGEAFAWDSLLWGCAGHDRPWHIVNDTSWRGPLQLKKNEKGINESLCADERHSHGGPHKLKRGRRGGAPYKSERCLGCTEIVMNAVKQLPSEA